MNNKHAKSPCCQEKVCRFGKRRRQCVDCGRTWRIRKKKRGRKNRRAHSEKVIKYLQHEILPSYVLSRTKNLSKSTFQRRITQSLNYFLNRTDWPPLPKDKELILSADALMKHVGKKIYTFYFFLLRPINSHEAIPLPPFIQIGYEHAFGWRRAIRQLPDDLKSRIIALVCDGHRELVSQALRRNWLLQRCHFHLLAAIQGRRSWKRRGRHRELGQWLYQHANIVLTTTNIDLLQESLLELKRISQTTNSKTLRTVLSGFVKHYTDYRTYINYPNLNLPRTNNAMESLISGIGNLCQRARGFRTPISIVEWIHAYLKNRRKFTCRGSKNQPN